MDVFSSEKRSRIMAQVRGKDTKPELMVRKVLHGLGFRFRLHKKELPGKPDIVLARYKKAIFVHGCFWHGHHCKRGGKPSSNTIFWNEKLNRNQIRDQENLQKLVRLGWHCLTVWECETKNIEVLTERLTAFMESKS